MRTSRKLSARTKELISQSLSHPGFRGEVAGHRVHPVFELLYYPVGLLLTAFPDCITIKTGLLFVSGFYVEDMPMIIGMAQNSGLTYVSHDNIDNWCCIKFAK